MNGYFGWGEAGWGEAGIEPLVAAPVDPTSQWTLGLITVTRGSATVTGVGTDWAGNVSPGHLLFAILPDILEASVIYEIDAVANDNELTLVAPWQGPSVGACPYLIHRRAASWPRLRREDDGIAQLITYTLSKIDLAIAAYTEPLPGEDWILAAGTWNDANIWRDEETWED